jgi:predicted enzyme related to lactoylglutathione lyase
MTFERANTILYCRRFHDTVAFYEEGFRLRVLTRRDWFVEFELGAGAALSIADEQRATIESGEGRGITISLRVQDAARSRKELVAAGLDPGPMRTSFGSPAFFVFDPEGHRLEVWSP